MNLLDIDHSKIYKYGDQGINDYGWGCVYRNVQTLSALHGREIPTISEMQKSIGIDPDGNGRNLWIEPVDTQFYLPWKTTLALHKVVEDPENYMLRTKEQDFDKIFTNNIDTKEFLLSCLNHNSRVLLDDSISSYILTGIVDDQYVYIDPHVQNDNVRTMTEKEFFNRSIWMMLC